MSTEQQAPVWGTVEPVDAVALGAPEPPKTMSKTKTIVAAVVAGVVVVGGGVAVVSAVTTSNSGTTQAGGPGGNGVGGGRNGFGGGVGASGLSDALYGDFVASDGNGGYATKRLQSGTVTAVSSTSVTAKSADGHTTTFVLNSSTQVDNGNAQVSGVKTGDTVVVVGTVSGSTATASTITDTTLMGTNGFQQGGGQDGPGGTGNQRGGPGT